MPKRGFYGRYNLLQIVYHLDCRDSDNLETLFAQELVPDSIRLSCILTDMHYAVDFDDYLVSWGTEVNNASSNRMLPAEMHSGGMILQRVP